MMKRREILKMLGVGALSLTGIERFVKAMATPAPSPTEWTCDEEVACVVSASPGGEVYLTDCTGDVCPVQFTCNGRATNFYCSNFNCTVQHTCNPQPAAGDFRCYNLYSGCSVGQQTGTFQCLGIDPGPDAQFICIGNFRGCGGIGVFDCDDFRCRGTYDCGAGHAGCPTPVPGVGVDCQNIAGGYHS